MSTNLDAPPALAEAWADAWSALDGLPGGGLNIAHEAVDRHVPARAGQVALRLLGKRGDRRDVTYGELARLTDQFANLLRELRVGRGDRVVVLCTRTLALYVAVLGGLKRGAVVCPLFSAFGPGPVAERLRMSRARLVVTTAAIYERTLAGRRDAVPDLETVLLSDPELDDASTPYGTLPLWRLLDGASAAAAMEHTNPEDPALLHFTSGTTGRPKGAVHVHAAVVVHHATGRSVLDLHAGDVFWCTADPGWVTGTSYGIIAPLTHGATCVVDEAEIDVARWYRILADEAVDVWYTAPTAIRVLMRAGRDIPELALPRPHLRLATSVGEPLPADAVHWGAQVLGLPFHDNWWQTETGGIMIANPPGSIVRAGSMGVPLAGVEATVLECDDEGEVIRGDSGVREIVDPGESGMLALRAGWPSMFRTYLDDPDRYARCFVDGWYVTGDLVRRDTDGYYWFVARADDVIKTAGHLIGPFEVESVMRTHPAVADVGVYGFPDAIAGQVVHSVVVPWPGREPSVELRRDLLAHARRQLGAAVAPRAIIFATELPKTKSGKVMRRLLRARELGLPEGDTSTLESSARG